MRILGVDPGLNTTGYGVIEIETVPSRTIKLLEAGIIRPRSSDLLQNRINKIYQHLQDIVGEFHPTVMVLEKLYSHYRHPTTACQMGHIRGVICLLCAQQGLTLVEHSVKRIRKSLVGQGSASKQQTQEWVARMLNIDKNKLTLDASDALALVLGYASMQRVTPSGDF